MQLKLNKLVMENFAGFKNQTFEFNGQDADIFGQNGTGKTTTATALQWLLFDKGLDGSTKSFNPVPEDEKSEEQYELIPTVIAEFDIDGGLLTLKKESHPKYSTNQKTNRKEYNRSRTKYQYINDEKVKVTDFKNRIAEIIDEDVFKLITNPGAFNQLDWKVRRNLLFEIADDISDDDVISSDPELEGLKELLTDYDIETKKKIVGDKIKQINQQIKDIPTRINEASHSLVEVEELNEFDYKQLEDNIQTLVNKRYELQNGSAEIELRNQVKDKQAELERIKRDHSSTTESRIHSLMNEFNAEESTILNYKSKMKNNQTQIQYEEGRRKELLAEHKRLKSDLEKAQNNKFEYVDEKVCSCCGQDLPNEKVEETRENALKKFNKEKSLQLEVVTGSMERVLEDGKKIKPIIDALNEENNKHQKLRDLATEKSKKIKNKIDNLKSQITDVTQSSEYQEVQRDIDELNKKRMNIQEEVDDRLDELDSQLNELNAEKEHLDKLKSIAASNKNIEIRIQELRNKEDELLDEKEIYSGQLYKLNKFTITKINKLTDNINQKFKYVTFKLFYTQVDGEIKETCETTVNGIEYHRGLNSAKKLNAGLDIINTLCDHYKINAPIFIDNAESVIDILPTKSQQIRLVVSKEDDTLRMEKSE
ncbi:AAA family ATPase [Mammaliicoccus sciuri]|uniref:AAA family ATPase n=1 Tax=Mammaliicoccus sciuri TaxID=1296 RepID=UPI002DBDFB70|nr:AAA family ATPase [Mammaliicoccus sciuri]MEB8265141.1 AAA family ATPase [Mammaliicoccus sciuri]